MVRRSFQPTDGETAAWRSAGTIADSRTTATASLSRLLRRPPQVLRPFAQMRVVLRDHLRRTVPEQLRDRRDRHPVLQRIGRESVAVGVDVDRLVERGAL